MEQETPQQLHNPICPHCAADPFLLSLNVAQLGPLQVATIFCGNCYKVVGTHVIGMIQPKVAPSPFIPPNLGRKN